LLRAREILFEIPFSMILGRFNIASNRRLAASPGKFPY